ncbi:MAG: rhomboid family intramembrane serine protease [Treponema sp.]|nr:rhomboid family intramembrane serine protease [Treponema sp.]
MNILRQPLRYANFNITYWLIGINILVFAAMHFFGNTVAGNFDVVDGYGRHIDRYILRLRDILVMIPYVVVKNGAVWTFITYMFMHADLTHIFFNMLGLFIFGLVVERQMGSWEFLIFYLITGILAGVFSFIVFILTGGIFIALLGASGALYAVMLAYAVFFPRSVIHIWGILPIRAPVMVLVFTALSLFFIFSGRGGNVAHLTHLAGFIFAWLYFLVRFGVNPWKRLTGR